jgi:predicted amidohydrolase YtcJ
MFRLTTALIFCLSMYGCGESAIDERTEVDTILHNGKVLTMDDDLSIASVVAVSGTDIVAVGGQELLERYRSRNMRDLGGKVLMPGFVDSHTHYALAWPATALHRPDQNPLDRRDEGAGSRQG